MYILDQMKKDEKNIQEKRVKEYKKQSHTKIAATTVTIRLLLLDFTFENNTRRF